MRAISNKLMIIAILMIGMAAATSAQDSMMKSDKTMADPMMAKHPIVAVIRADWCAACKKLEPVLAEIAKSYGEKVEFVYLDITDAKTTAEAEAMAKRYGISKFFEENKKKSSTVGIFKNMKKLFNTHYNADLKVFTAEIDKALAS